MTTCLLQEGKSFRVVQGMTENCVRSGEATFDLLDTPTAF